MTFNEPVTGVDASDFTVAVTGGVIAPLPLYVGGSGSVYAVTINGISGTGGLGLNLVDDGSIKNAIGNPLQPGGAAAFQLSATYATQLNPFPVVSADLNLDGKQDLVFPQGHSIGLLLGNGNGTFQAAQTIGLGPIFVVRTVAVSDVNDDGRPDLVLGGDTFSGTTVCALLGNGDGTFQVQPEFAASSASPPIFIAVSDVDLDGRPDVIVSDNNSVSLLAGNGDGTFKAPHTLAYNVSTRSVAISDLNGDGRPDVVVTDNRGGVVIVMLGNGNGSFQREQTLAVNSSPWSSAVSDVNGDGKPDLLGGNATDGTIFLFLGNGNGTFQPQQTVAGGAFCVVSDVNGDGRADLILSVYNGAVAVCLGNGNGTFQDSRTFATGAPRFFASYVVAAPDLNGDGRPDLVGSLTSTHGPNNTTSGVSVLLGSTDGGFIGQVYTIVQNLDSINETADAYAIKLTRNADQIHIDWQLATTIGQMLINDANGLTINGDGQNVPITLDYTNGNPLPNTLHLNGTFTINGLQGTNPLAGTNLEIGRSTVFISYANAAADPVERDQAVPLGRVQQRRVDRHAHRLHRRRSPRWRRRTTRCTTPASAGPTSATAPTSTRRPTRSS